MASTSMEPPFGRAAEKEDKFFVGEDDSSDDDGEEVMEVRRRVSRFAVDGDSGAGGASEVARRRVSRFAAEEGAGLVQDWRRGVGEGGRALPPPHAWLAVEETKIKKGGGFGSENEEQWARLLQRGGSAQAEAAEAQQKQKQPRRSSFSVVRRERGAREAWLDRAWEMKRNWHERNGGAPDADTPVVVVVGTKQQQQQQQQHGGGSRTSSPSCSSPHRHGHGHAAAGVAMDMEEVRACRDLGFELPSDGSVEIQCYGISAGSSPTHSHAGSGSGSGSGSPSTSGSCSITSPSAGEDPVDVKARLKVWAQAVALASTTHLGS